MTETTPERITVRHHVERFNGQHGTIILTDPTTTDRPVHVLLDGETEPRHFNHDELGPNTQDADLARRETDLNATITLLEGALDLAGINPSDADRHLVGYLAGLGATGRQIAHWLAVAHDTGTAHQRRITARTQLAAIDPKYVTETQWAAEQCILCGAPLKTVEHIGDVGGFNVYACPGGCQAGTEHSTAGTTAAEEITGSDEPTPAARFFSDFMADLKGQQDGEQP